jgi:hypothetical protein
VIYRAHLVLLECTEDIRLAGNVACMKEDEVITEF